MTRILVIDDEEMIRDNLDAYLYDEGYDVKTSGTAEDALDMLKQGDRFELAIVDVRLPGMDGSEFILDAYKVDPNMQFILHTGSSEFVLSAELKQIGLRNEQIVFKPLIQMEKLLNLINELLVG